MRQGLALRRISSFISQAPESIRDSQAESVKPTAATYAGIFLASASVLLFELVLIRIFAVMLWAHLAFMVVGTALFGFGLSGVYLALRRAEKSSNLALISAAISISMLAAYLVIQNVPFTMWSMNQSSINFLYLGIWYIALIIPFFFAGLLIAELLRSYPARSNRLYGFDLLGAAFGSLLIIPVIQIFAGEGALACCSLLAVLAALLFTRAGQWKLRLGLIFLLLAMAALIPQARELMPVQLHQTKRQYNDAVRKNYILSTRWSPISRVDVAKLKPLRSFTKRKMRAIWIDGGTNESIMLRWRGKLEELKPLNWSSIGASYALKSGSSPNVLVIGSSGGREVLFALSHGAGHVDAVEMDPSIVRMLREPENADFMGRIFELPQVSLINDEGRSYLRRQPNDLYDVIQTVNNYTPVAIASGAMNISENFLFTKQAFNDFLDHLKPDGVLAVHRGEILRIALMAAAVLRERGIEHPEKHMLITNSERSMFYGFLLKKSPWTLQETKKIDAFMRNMRLEGGFTFQWNPLDQERETIYSKVLARPVSEQAELYRSLDLNLEPPTDNRPFLGHYLFYGKQDLRGDLPPEFLLQAKKKVFGSIPRGDFPYIVILLESAALALLFIALPLLLFARKVVHTPGFPRFFAYFAALGFGYITIEICFMQHFVLFLGNPAYSISTIFVSLLCGSGLGSLFSEKLSPRDPLKAVVIAVCLITAVVLLQDALLPLAFGVFLKQTFIVRLLVAVLLLLPAGFVMGLAFPCGLRLINSVKQSDQDRRQLTAWVWGINGYATVVGSAAAVFLTLLFGFHATLWIAVAGYFFSMIFLWLGRKALQFS